MAFDKVPQNWIPGIQLVSLLEGPGVAIPLSSLPKLSASEVVSSTGDIRKVYFALIDALHSAFVNKPTVDQPLKMGVGKEYEETNDSLLLRMRVIFDFLVTDFNSDVLPEPEPVSYEVADEP